ncbi:MAG: acyl-CoA thioesterase [Candidatus Marinimicrobia bacterium CG_4_10_14_0_2_um_filter_48_9]|nr:MAG: acyl-CoA thioesterase [Candidatus Marinimicrobia bacterium CG_4_10_14_0_2_um_filter_48_9]
MQPSYPISSWEIVFPNDANAHNTMFGGKIMAIMDKMAGIAASRYAHNLVVTASTEGVHFKLPVRVGERIETTARVVWVGHSSMVVKVDVTAENFLTAERRDCTTAHFNMVALDENGKPTKVPPLEVKTPAEMHDYAVAEIVKKKALERKQNIEAEKQKSPRS